jgi:alginate O-acetyltransferase complex protein AlgI
LVGPIIRFHEIADQIENRNFYDTTENRLLGFFRFAIGLAKKVLLADVLAIHVDKMFSLSYGIPDVTTAWLGAFLNVLHIYIDFSAYSDMALGLALMIGFRFPENFNSPLIAESVTEFWLRWHMSLNRWLREYIYIPLGGNRGTELQTCLNILTVFLLSGIWHGANWNFIIWGICCGLVIIGERVFLQQLLKKAPRVIRILVAQGLIAMLLVLFKCHSVKEGFHYLRYMYTSTSHTAILFFSLKTKLVIAISIFIAIGSLHPYLERLAHHLYSPSKNRLHYGWMLAGSIVLVVLSASYISIIGQHPFLYFKF